MTVAPYVRPDYPTQSGTSYPLNIDAMAKVFERIAAAFAPRAEDPPTMTIRVGAGTLFNTPLLIDAAEQGTGVIAPPLVNPRIDRVVIDARTGVVVVIAGIEAITPNAPPIPSGALPVCRVALTPGQTQITNAQLSDERSVFMAPPPEPVRVLARVTAVVDVVNTVLETAIFSYAVPGNTLGTNRMLRLTVLGDAINGSGGLKTLLVRVVYGVTQIATGQFNTNNSATRSPFKMELCLGAKGATNAQVAHTLFQPPTLGAPGTVNGTAHLNYTPMASMHNAVAEDSTATQTLAVTLQWDTAQPSLSARCFSVQLESL